MAHIAVYRRDPSGIAFPAVWGLCPLQEGLVTIPYGLHKGLYTWFPIFPLSSVGVCSYTQIWPDIEVCRGWSRASDFWVTHSACLEKRKRNEGATGLPACTGPIRCRRAANRCHPSLCPDTHQLPLCLLFFTLRLLLIFFRAVKWLTGFKQFTKVHSH